MSDNTSLSGSFLFYKTSISLKLSLEGREKPAIFALQNSQLATHRLHKRIRA